MHMCCQNSNMPEYKVRHVHSELCVNILTTVSMAFLKSKKNNPESWDAPTARGSDKKPLGLDKVY